MSIFKFGQWQPGKKKGRAEVVSDHLLSKRLQFIGSRNFGDLFAPIQRILQPCEVLAQGNAVAYVTINDALHFHRVFDQFQHTHWANLEIICIIRICLQYSTGDMENSIGRNSVAICVDKGVGRKLA